MGAKFRGPNPQKRPQPPKYRKEITRKKTVKICGIDAKGCPFQSVNWKRQAECRSNREGLAEWIWFGWSRGAEKSISKTKIVSSKKDYIRFITELKRNIVRSRYIAASLANREQLLLYFRTGKMLSEKIATQKWGVNVLQSISSDLQKQLPGLRGFSDRNLRNMRQFFEVYNSTSIWQSLWGW